MSNEKKGIIILSILVVILLGLVGYLLVTKKDRYEFYARVKESYSGSSIIEPLHNEKIYDDYQVLQIDVGNLKEGDIIKVSTNGEFLETYPPVAKVDKYEFIINNTTNTTDFPKTTTTINTVVNTTKPIETEKVSTTKNTTSNVKKTTIKRVTTTKSINEISKDNIVLSNLQSNINTIESNKNNKSFGQTAKEYFTNTIDFIFYGKDIKGVYFKDLTNSAKLKVISLALKLDNLIDKHYPGYKEGLSSSYQNAKTKLVELYLDKTSEYCANNDAVCAQAKSDFQDLKTCYGITWEFIKDLGNKGISKLKEWYEVYSGKQN